MGHRHTPMITTMHSDQNGSPPRVEVITSVPAASPLADRREDPASRGGDAARDVGVLRGPASGRRSELAVQLASTNAGRWPASRPG
jgi:hypothetical protein